MIAGIAIAFRKSESIVIYFYSPTPAPRSDETASCALTVPLILVVILALRWWQTRLRNNKPKPGSDAFSDNLSQAELAQKPNAHDTDQDSIITENRDLPRPMSRPLLHANDTDNSSSDVDAESNKQLEPGVKRRPLSETSTFVPDLSYPFSPDADKPSRSFKFPNVNTRRASAGDTSPSTYRSPYRKSAIISSSMPTSPTTPTNITFPHSRHTSHINTNTSSPPPSPSQWLSRSPGGSTRASARLSLQEDKVIGYRRREVSEVAIDLSRARSKNQLLTQTQLSPV